MGNAIIIPQNLMSLSQSNIVAGSEASASMADGNMLTEKPSNFWRSTQATPDCTYFYGTFSKSRTFDVNAAAIVGHNLRRGDQYRTWCYPTSGDPTRPAGFTAYNPDTKIVGASSNSASVVGDVDNSFDSTPSTWAIPTTVGTGWAFSVGFPAVSPAPATGADMQSFWVFVKTAVDATLNPMPVTVYLNESGVNVANLGTRYITSASGQWLFFAWDASQLGTSSGANVECRVVMDGSATYWVSIGSIVWACDGDGAQTNDSGWITYSDDAGSGVVHRPEQSGELGTTLIRMPATIDSARRVYVQLRVCRSPLDYDETAEILPSCMDYAQVGTLVVGVTWVPTINFGYGRLVGGIDQSTRSRTYGGQLFGSRRPVRRVVSIKFGHLTPAECHTLFDRMIWRHGSMKPFLISLLPDDASQSKHTTIFCVLRNPENWINIQPDEGYENSMDMEFEEVL